ncbi:MAG: flavodoxin [Candidatus Obscuribacter sp.]|nr:flavodoxin [Candidatus Obscuribacter sp.]MBK9277993.1 flavodoxin [Candidatus Obscuribacter sp.]HMX44891.1 flavodoxin [Candidatus Obscuribacter sp.]
MIGKLFYGTQTGTTEDVARRIGENLPELIVECRNIYGVKKEEFVDADLLILGGSTWGDGELTDDWQNSLPILDTLDLTGKSAALFGLGDQVGYCYNFVSAMKLLYDKVRERGARIIASDISADGFEFEHSESLIEGKFTGLVLDEVNQPHKTDERIRKWTRKVREFVGAIA